MPGESAILKGRSNILPSVELYVELLQLDLLSPLPTVKALIREAWTHRLREKDRLVGTLPYALKVAEELQFRDLQGDLYYLQLRD